MVIQPSEASGLKVIKLLLLRAQERMLERMGGKWQRDRWLVSYGEEFHPIRTKAAVAAAS